jgi:hypothetical protein
MPSIFDDAPEQPADPQAADRQGRQSGQQSAGQSAERPAQRPTGQPDDDPSRDPSRGQPGPSRQPREPVFNRTPRVRQQFGGVLQTAGDAYAVCQALFDEQIELAATERATPNEPIAGDSSARTAFQMLLTDAQQRELFLHTASNQRSWPRLKALIGAPPYHFLMPQDAAVLNAAGFARGRANMTYETGGTVANQNQFGPGQLVDEHTREYRISPRQIAPSDPLPGADYFNNATKDLVLQVKVKKHTNTEKRNLYHSEFKKQLFFPQPGETITLQETSRLLSARGLRVPSRTRLRVKALWPRANGKGGGVGSTAAILVGF